MITIKIYDGKWRMEINSEIWEFDTLEQLRTNHNNILEIKDRFGRIK